jgi:hypothetical protein
MPALIPLNLVLPLISAVMGLSQGLQMKKMLLSTDKELPSKYQSSTKEKKCT